MRLIAQVGNGSDYLIDNVSKLNPSVVKALARASGISIQKCEIRMGSESFSVNQIYQGEMYRKICLIDTDQLENFEVTFTAEKDFEGKELIKEWSYSDFIELPADSGLIVQAVKEQIDKISSPQERIRLSVQYGVLCDGTAFYLAVDQQK